MDTYYTIEEKYLQAVAEMNYGEAPLSLKLLNEILAEDPLFVRAHYQIAKLYYYDLHDYQSAGYHFKLCTQTEPMFPNVYFHYISLLVFLGMDKQVAQVAKKALQVPGVDVSAIYNLMGMSAEKKHNFEDALAFYKAGLMSVTGKSRKDEIEENIDRVEFKIGKGKTYSYHLSG